MPGIALLIGVALSMSCARYGRMGGIFQASGTCSGACDHYLDCRDGEPPDAGRRCMRECNDIYVQDGEPDTESLRDFESLECEAAVAFVEGDGRRRGDGESRAKAPPDGGQSKSR